MCVCNADTRDRSWFTRDGQCSVLLDVSFLKPSTNSVLTVVLKPFGSRSGNSNTNYCFLFLVFLARWDFSVINHNLVQLFDIKSLCRLELYSLMETHWTTSERISQSILFLLLSLRLSFLAVLNITELPMAWYVSCTQPISRQNKNNSDAQIYFVGFRR